jgi:hypothetical protein
MRRRRVILVALFTVSLLGSFVGLLQMRSDDPLLILAWFLLFIGWALMIRWWLVAGALIGYLSNAIVTGPQYEPNIARMVFWIVAGAGVGCFCEFLRRPESKPPSETGQSSNSTVPDSAAENASP